MKMSLMRAIYVAVITILSLYGVNGAIETRVDKIGSNTILNDYVNATGSGSSMVSLNGSRYLTVWRAGFTSNLNFEARIVDVSDPSTLNATQGTIVNSTTPLPSTWTIYEPTLTKLQDNIALMTWLKTSNNMGRYLIGRLIRSNPVSSNLEFIGEEFVIYDNTSSFRVSLYDISPSSNDSFSFILRLDNGTYPYLAMKSFRYHIYSSSNMSISEIGTILNVVSPSYSSSGYIASPIDDRFLVLYHSPPGFDPYDVYGKIYMVSGNQVINTTSPFLVARVTADRQTPREVVKVGNMWVVIWNDRLSNTRLMCTGVDVNGVHVADDFEIFSAPPQVIKFAAVGSNRFVVIYTGASVGPEIWFKMIEYSNGRFTTVGNDTRVDEPHQNFLFGSTVSGDENGTFGIAWMARLTNFQIKIYTQFYRVYDIVSTTQSISTGIVIGTTIGSIVTGGTEIPSDRSTSGNSIGSDQAIIIIVVFFAALLCLILVAIAVYLRIPRLEDTNDDEFEFGDGYSSVRIGKTRTKINDRFYLVDKITQDEALQLENDVGIHISFPSGVTRVSYLVGEGNGGKVRLAKDDKDNRFAGVKKLKGDAKIARFEDEHRIQLELDHPNILKLIDSVSTQDSQGGNVLYLFMPLLMMDGLTFCRIIQSFEFHDIEILTAHVFRGVLAGVMHMHRINYYHRDLKLSNILIGKDGEVKIIDFGTTIYLENGRLSKVGGDVATFAPECNELARHEHVSISAKHVDSWAIGLAMLEVLIGSYPLEKMGLEQMMARTRQHYQEKVGDALMSLSNRSTLKPIVSEMLEIDPLDRIEIKGATGMFAQLPQPDISALFVELRSSYRDNMAQSSETGQIYVSTGDKYGPTDDYQTGDPTDDYQTGGPTDDNCTIPQGVGCETGDNYMTNNKDSIHQNDDYMTS